MVFRPFTFNGLHLKWLLPQVGLNLPSGYLFSMYHICPLYPFPFFCLLLNWIFIVYCLLYRFISYVFFKWLLQVQQYTSIIYHSLSSSNIMLLHIQYHNFKEVYLYLPSSSLCVTYCSHKFYLYIYFTTPCIFFVLNCNYHLKWFKKK